MTGFHTGLKRDLNQRSRWQSAAGGIRNSTYGIVSIVMLAWVLDARTGYHVDNIVYGLALSGSAGIVASGADILEKQERLVTHPETVAEVNRTVGFISFGSGFLVQMLVLFLKESTLEFIPNYGAEFFNHALVVSLILFLFFSSIWQLILILLGSVILAGMPLTGGLIGLLIAGQEGLVAGVAVVYIYSTSMDDNRISGSIYNGLSSNDQASTKSSAGRKLAIDVEETYSRMLDTILIERFYHSLLLSH